ncbi:MAG: hypothetical protein L3I91_01915 [Mycoplasma sp.]
MFKFKKTNTKLLIALGLFGITSFGAINTDLGRQQTKNNSGVELGDLRNNLQADHFSVTYTKNGEHSWDNFSALIENPESYANVPDDASITLEWTYDQSSLINCPFINQNNFTTKSFKNFGNDKTKWLQNPIFKPVKDFQNDNYSRLAKDVLGGDNISNLLFFTLVDTPLNTLPIVGKLQWPVENIIGNNANWREKYLFDEVTEFTTNYHDYNFKIATEATNKLFNPQKLKSINVSNLSRATLEEIMTGPAAQEAKWISEWPNLTSVILRGDQNRVVPTEHFFNNSLEQATTSPVRFPKLSNIDYIDDKGVNHGFSVKFTGADTSIARLDLTNIQINKINLALTTQIKKGIFNKNNVSGQPILADTVRIDCSYNELNKISLEQNAFTRKDDDYGINIITPKFYNLYRILDFYNLFYDKFSRNYTSVIADYKTLVFNEEGFLNNISTDTFNYFYQPYEKVLGNYLYFDQIGGETLADHGAIINPIYTFSYDRMSGVNFDNTTSRITIGGNNKKAYLIGASFEGFVNALNLRKSFTIPNLQFDRPTISLNNDEVQSRIQDVINDASLSTSDLKPIININNHQPNSTEINNLRFKLYQNVNGTWKDISNNPGEGLTFDPNTGSITHVANKLYSVNNLRFSVYLNGLENETEKVIDKQFNINISRYSDIRFSDSFKNTLKAKFLKSNNPGWIKRNTISQEGLSNDGVLLTLNDYTHNWEPINFPNTGNITYTYEFKPFDDNTRSKYFNKWTNVSSVSETLSILIRDWDNKRMFFWGNGGYPYINNPELAGHWRIKATANNVTNVVFEFDADLSKYTSFADDTATTINWPTNIGQETLTSGYTYTPDLGETKYVSNYQNEHHTSLPLKGTDEANQIRWKLFHNDTEVDDNWLRANNVSFNNETGQITLQPRTAYNIDNLKLGIYSDILEGNNIFKQPNAFSIHVTKQTTLNLNQQYDIDQSSVYRNGYDSGSLVNYVTFGDGSRPESNNLLFTLYSGNTELRNLPSGVTFDSRTGRLQIQSKKVVNINQLWVGVRENSFSVSSTKPANPINLNITNHGGSFNISANAQPQSGGQETFTNGYNYFGLINSLTFADGSRLTNQDRSETSFALEYQQTSSSSWTDISNNPSIAGLRAFDRSSGTIAGEPKAYNVRGLRIKITNSFYNFPAQYTNVFTIFSIDAREFNINGGIPTNNTFTQENWYRQQTSENLQTHIYQNGSQVTFDPNVHSFVLYKNGQKFTPNPTTDGFSFNTSTGQITTVAKKAINVSGLSIALNVKNVGETPRSAPFNIRIIEQKYLKYSPTIPNLNKENTWANGYTTPNLRTSLKYTDGTNEVSPTSREFNNISFVLYQNGSEVNPSSLGLSLNTNTGVLTVSGHKDYNLSNLKIVAKDTQYNITSANYSNSFSINVVNQDGLSIRQAIPNNINIFTWYQNGYITPDLSNAMYYTKDRNSSKIDQATARSRISFAIYLNQADVTNQVIAKGISFNRQTGQLTFNKANLQNNFSFTGLYIKATDSYYGFSASTNRFNIDNTQFLGDLSIQATISNIGQDAFNASSPVNTPTLNNKICFGNQHITNTSHLNQYCSFKLLLNGLVVSNQWLNDNHLSFNNTTGVLSISPNTAYNLDNLSIKVIDSYFNKESRTNTFSIHVTKFTKIGFDNLDNILNDFVSDNKLLEREFTTASLVNHVVYDESQTWNANPERLTFKLLKNNVELSDDDIVQLGLAFNKSNGSLTIKANIAYDLTNLAIKVVDSYFNINATSKTFNIKVTEPPKPTPSNNVIGPVLGGIFGGIGLTGAGAGTIAYKRRNDKKRIKIK